MASQQVGTSEGCKWTRLTLTSLRLSQIAERGSASVIFVCMHTYVCMLNVMSNYRIKYPVSPSPLLIGQFYAQLHFVFVPFKCGQASSIFSPCIIEFLSFTFPIPFPLSFLLSLSLSLSLFLAPKTKLPVPLFDYPHSLFPPPPTLSFTFVYLLPFVLLC